MGRLLAHLGAGYQHTLLANEELTSLKRLKEFDVVFLTCARPVEADFRSIQPLRKYVAEGGTLYASDLRYSMIIAAFPEVRPPVIPEVGQPQLLGGKIVDPGLKEHVGKGIIQLRFDATLWRPAVFHPAKTTALMTGYYRTIKNESKATTYLTRFRFREGTVIFTSFHNARQNTEMERKLLEYLVMSAVNARSEARITTLMRDAGFPPEEIRNVQLTLDQPVVRTYQHTHGSLQIAAGFESVGVKVKLTVTAPDGREITHEDASTFLLEVPNAAAGEWRYSVAPLELPFAGFPAVTAVGRSEPAPKE
jgi:hypothetical protein